MKTIAIIPARGGSKRIPRKNIKEFCGKPVIFYPIKAAIDSKIFDEVIVSTDDEEIRDISLSFGASVPFMRSPENSGDHAGTIDVIIEVLKKLQFGDCQICCLYPCVPLIDDKVLSKSFEEFSSSNSDSLVPMVKFGHPPQRAFVKDGQFISPKFPENIRKRSQDLESWYHDAGQFYWLKSSVLQKEMQIFTDKTVPFIMDEQYVQDIDTLSDWDMAELKYKSMKNI